MKKNTRMFKAVGKVLTQYGEKWGRKAGDRAVSYLTDQARKRGLSDKSYDLDSLTRELREMYRQGRFNQQEWQQVKQRLRQAWKEYRNRGGGS
jgi:uncharacterized protein YqgQ